MICTSLVLFLMQHSYTLAQSPNVMFSVVENGTADEMVGQFLESGGENFG